MPSEYQITSHNILCSHSRLIRCSLPHNRLPTIPTPPADHASLSALLTGGDEGVHPSLTWPAQFDIEPAELLITKASGVSERSQGPEELNISSRLRCGAASRCLSCGLAASRYGKRHRYGCGESPFDNTSCADVLSRRGCDLFCDCALFSAGECESGSTLSNATCDHVRLWAPAGSHD